VISTLFIAVFFHHWCNVVSWFVTRILPCVESHVRTEAKLVTSYTSPLIGLHKFVGTHHSYWRPNFKHADKHNLGILITFLYSVTFLYIDEPNENR